MNLEMLKQKRREFIRKRQEKARNLGDINTRKAFAFIVSELKNDADTDNRYDLWIGICDHIYPGINRDKLVSTIIERGLQADIHVHDDAPARDKWIQLHKRVECDKYTCKCIHIKNTWADCGSGSGDAPNPAATIKAEKP
jgi:hypothetical protein